MWLAGVWPGARGSGPGRGGLAGRLGGLSGECREESGTGDSAGTGVRRGARSGPGPERGAEYGGVVAGHGGKARRDTGSAGAGGVRR